MDMVDMDTYLFMYVNMYVGYLTMSKAHRRL